MRRRKTRTKSMGVRSDDDDDDVCDDDAVDDDEMARQTAHL